MMQGTGCSLAPVASSCWRDTAILPPMKDLVLLAIARALHPLKPSCLVEQASHSPLPPMTDLVWLAIVQQVLPHPPRPSCLLGMIEPPVLPRISPTTCFSGLKTV